MKNKFLFKVAIGKFIRDKRAELNYSQDELANLLGISKTAVSNWENGNYIVDVKYLVPLSNILCVTVDDLLFPKYQLQKQQYCDISVQFQDMLRFAHKMEKRQVEKLLEIYVENKRKTVYLIEQYIQTKDAIWLQQAKDIDIFGLTLSRGMGKPFVYLDTERILKFSNLGDQLETMWAPMFFIDITSVENIVPIEPIERTLPHIFHDKWAISCYWKSETKGAGMSETSAMLELIFTYGGKRVFLEYLKTFSQRARNKILYNLKNFSEMTNRQTDKTIVRAMRLLLKAEAEYWVDGENKTQELMREIL